MTINKDPLKNGREWCLTICGEILSQLTVYIARFFLTFLGHVIIFSRLFWKVVLRAFVLWTVGLKLRKTDESPICSLQYMIDAFHLVPQVWNGESIFPLCLIIPACCYCHNKASALPVVFKKPSRCKTAAVCKYSPRNHRRSYAHA